MADNYTHADGSRECRPVEAQPPDDLFAGTEAAPPRTVGPDDWTPEMRATMDRLARNPVALLMVNALRLEQVTLHQRTDASDAAEDWRKMFNRMQRRIDDTRDLLVNGGPAQRDAAIRKLAIAAAMQLAMIDKANLEDEHATRTICTAMGEG